MSSGDIPRRKYDTVIDINKITLTLHASDNEDNKVNEKECDESSREKITAVADPGYIRAYLVKIALSLFLTATMKSLLVILALAVTGE